VDARHRWRWLGDREVFLASLGRVKEVEDEGQQQWHRRLLGEVVMAVV
jgi:hypothetical protein